MQAETNDLHSPLPEPRCLMANTIYVTGFPGPAGTLDWPTLGPVPGRCRRRSCRSPCRPWAGLSAAGVAAGSGYQRCPVRARRSRPACCLTPVRFSVEWPGARPTIYPAASIGRSTAPDDVPPNLSIPGCAAGGPRQLRHQAVRRHRAGARRGQGGAGTIALLDPDGEPRPSRRSGTGMARSLDLLRGEPGCPVLDLYRRGQADAGRHRQWPWPQGVPASRSRLAHWSRPISTTRSMAAPAASTAMLPSPVSASPMAWAPCPSTSSRG